MDFPLGFPSRLKPRAEAAVLKAMHGFAESEIGPRIDVGFRAFANIAIEAARKDEWAVEIVHGALDQFLDYLVKNFAFGGSALSHMAFLSYPLDRMKSDIKTSPEWISYMEQLDAIASRKERRRTKRKSPKAKETIHGQIENLRSECRLTVEQLAEALDISPRSIHRHLSGKAIPRKSHIAEYERVFSEKLKKSIRLQNVR
jgi:DNA-binding transcriptional regulator YiaG